jgi:addiction module RelB/DinJ family antitoxin
MVNLTRTTGLQIIIKDSTKERAMPVLQELGVSISDLVDMLLVQVAEQGRIPFETPNYSHIMPSSENEYHTFDTWSDAKEWLNA